MGSMHFFLKLMYIEYLDTTVFIKGYRAIQYV